MTDSVLMDKDGLAFQLRNANAQRHLSAGRAVDPGSTDRDIDLEEASRQFESLLLNFMIREMRATIPESGLFGKSMAEDIFTSMLDEQYGDQFSRAGGIGLSRMIVEQMGQKNANVKESNENPETTTKLK